MSSDFNLSAVDFDTVGSTDGSLRMRDYAPRVTRPLTQEVIRGNQAVELINSALYMPKVYEIEHGGNCTYRYVTPPVHPAYACNLSNRSMLDHDFKTNVYIMLDTECECDNYYILEHTDNPKKPLVRYMVRGIYGSDKEIETVKKSMRLNSGRVYSIGRYLSDNAEYMHFPTDPHYLRQRIESSNNDRSMRSPKDQFVSIVNNVTGLTASSHEEALDNLANWFEFDGDEAKDIFKEIVNVSIKFVDSEYFDNGCSFSEAFEKLPDKEDLHYYEELHCKLIEILKSNPNVIATGNRILSKTNQRRICLASSNPYALSDTYYEFHDTIKKYFYNKAAKRS